MALTDIKQAGLDDEAVNESKLQISNAGTNGQYLQKQSGNTGGLTWADVPAGVGGATGVDFNDTVKARWGTDNDLEIVHSGSHATIKNITGNLNITNTGNNTIINSDNITFQSGDQGETIARFLDDDACELWYDNSKKFETKSYGANMPDNSQLYFGTGDDLVIKHDGTDSRIINAGSDLYLYTTGDHEVKILADSQNAVICKPDAAVELYYDNSKKLETSSTGATVTGSIIADNTPGKNLVINGSMIIAQRGTSYTSDQQGYQTVDRFKIGWSGADSVIEQHQGTLTSSDTGPWEEGFRKEYHLVNGNQSSGAGAADLAYLYHFIEAQDIASSGWDYTNASSKLTLSFWIKSSVAQNFYGYVKSQDGTAQLLTFETTALTANTWKKVTVSIPGHANLQFDNNAEAGLQIAWMPFFGTDYTTSGKTLNAWAAYSGSDRSPDNTSTWWTTDNATFQITGVQLEVGDAATTFEHRTYGDELLRCQRYFFATDNQWFALGRGNGASDVCISVDLPVPLRASPTVTLTAGNLRHWGIDSNSSSNTAPTIPSFRANQNCIRVNQGGHSGVNDDCVIAVQTDTNDGEGLTFAAEL